MLKYLKKDLTRVYFFGIFISEQRDKPKGKKMKELKTKTSTGKEAALKYENNNYILTVNSVGLQLSDSHIDVYLAKIKELNNNEYPVLSIAGKNIPMAYCEFQKLSDFLTASYTEKRNENDNKIENKIKGYIELRNAYQHRQEEIDKSEKFIQRAIETSIAHGDSGKPKKADELVKELEGKYPKAAAYIKWANTDPSTNYGYQASLAAQALLSGKTLEESQKIAKNYIVD